jgi:hypothetical protein
MRDFADIGVRDVVVDRHPRPRAATRYHRRRCKESRHREARNKER